MINNYKQVRFMTVKKEHKRFEYNQCELILTKVVVTTD